jgi:hypothetical protein
MSDKLPAGVSVIFWTRDNSRDEHNGKKCIVIRNTNNVKGYPYILAQIGSSHFGAAENEITLCSKRSEVLE